ncbi:MAG: flagellar basal body rod protein FlgB [Armatimonadetes bacterium]|nr:flagellar basal body rod protein FlgB [Armatimonadota bacterium]
MQILDDLYAGHIDRIQRSMGLASQRQELLVNNLANINTPGYKRKDMDFTVALEDAKSSTTEKLHAFQAARAKRSGTNASIRTDGNSVDLEREVYDISETELRYNILSDMAARYFSNLKNVIREGK